MSARQRQAPLPAHASRFAYSSLAQTAPATALSAFPSMVCELKGSETVLTGLLEDQSAVFGVAQIEALGLGLLELRQIRARPNRLKRHDDPLHLGTQTQEHSMTAADPSYSRRWLILAVGLHWAVAEQPLQVVGQKQEAAEQPDADEQHGKVGAGTVAVARES
jgi:hypothetical protein